eukprot:6197752-Prymnesium_polylepis.1
MGSARNRRETDAAVRRCGGRGAARAPTFIAVADCCLMRKPRVLLLRRRRDHRTADGDVVTVVCAEGAARRQ